LEIDASGADKIHFTVSNQGPSPEPAVAAEVFEPFFRHDYTGYEMVQGSGLGLYLVRECVRTHGGEVRMEPLSEGVRIAGCLHAPCLSDESPPVSATDE
jgi:two-component system sensor histidine kinase RstB